MSSLRPLTATGAPGPGDDLRYQAFLAEVARVELAAWLPAKPSLVLDLSLHCGQPSGAQLVGLMVDRGHTVIHADPKASRPQLPGPVSRVGRLVTVRAEARRLDWLAEGSVDVVVAEGGMLSEALAAELTVDEVHRVLRPGGRLLLCVDSLVSGLARLADQGCWAELADVPAADVVLVPGDDGHVSRCFWPEELHGMLSDVNFEVEWIRPRSVLSEQTVVRALGADADQLESLVATEVALSRRRQGESIGAQLVASARRAG
jgi:SAM-dependent methyltransferase